MKSVALAGVMCCAAAVSDASAQARVAINLNAHSQVEIERPAAAIWPHILDPGAWKQGVKLSHHAGPVGQVGHVLAAPDPARPGSVAYYVENVELVPNQRRTIKLYQPGGRLLGFATWTLEEANGRTGVAYDVYTENFLPDTQPAPTAEAVARQQQQGYEASKKRFDAELLALKHLVEQEFQATTPDSVRLWYRVVGSGRETVIAPAALYHARSLDALGRGRRLVLYDPRGRGRSDLVAPSKVSLEHEFLDLETIRRAVGADSFALVSWSGAGLAHFVYALRNPGRVTRLVQLTPLGPRRNPFLAQGGVTTRARIDTAAEARLNAKVAAGEFSGREAAHCRELERIFGPTRFRNPALVQLAPDVCDLQTEWPERAAAQSRAMMRSLGEYDWRSSLSRVTIPRLVIHGEHDAFPLAGSREWVAGQPNARLLILPGTGHWPQYERPEETIGAIEEFLQGRWPAGSRSIAR